MIVAIKKLHPEAHLPQYVKSGDITMDIVAVSKIFDEDGCIEYSTGLSISIPQGYIGMILPRSDNYKKDLILSDGIKIISPGDKDEIRLKFRPAAYFADEVVEPTEEMGSRGDTFDYVCFGKEYIEDDNNMNLYSVGDRIGQLIILPLPTIELVMTFDYSPDKNSSTTA